MLNFCSLLLLPLFTLALAGGEGWLDSNFSVRAVLGEGSYRGFVLWGLLAGGYFFVLLSRQIAALPGLWLRLGLHGLTLLCCSSLSYAIAIPYLPERFPRWADIHVAAATGACVLLMVILLLLILFHLRRDKKRYAPLLLGWGGIAVVSALLFLAAGMVSSALEVFFTLSTTLLARSLWLRQSPASKPSG